VIQRRSPRHPVGPLRSGVGDLKDGVMPNWSDWRTYARWSACASTGPKLPKLASTYRALVPVLRELIPRPDTRSAQRSRK
jgi:hypothetical protein